MSLSAVHPPPAMGARDGLFSFSNLIVLLIVVLLSGIDGNHGVASPCSFSMYVTSEGFSEKGNVLLASPLFRFQIIVATLRICLIRTRYTVSKLGISEASQRRHEITPILVAPFPLSQDVVARLRRISNEGCFSSWLSPHFQLRRLGRVQRAVTLSDDSCCLIDNIRYFSC